MITLHYCYCDLEDGSDRVCAPGTKPECDKHFARCKHFQMRRIDQDQEAEDAK